MHWRNFLQNVCVAMAVTSSLVGNILPAAADQTPRPRSDEVASTGLPPQPYGEEWKRTRPDFVVFLPAPDGKPRWDDPEFFVLNEHFIVVPVGEDQLLATWTAWGPKLRFLRVACARSSDAGRTWSRPIVLDGPGANELGDDRSAAWAVPIVAPEGRVYVIYNKNIGKVDFAHSYTGVMRCRFTDDGGRTWSESVTLPLRKSAIDHPSGDYPPNWIAWRQPEFDTQGRAWVPFTRTASPKAPLLQQAKTWRQCELMRLENLADHPDPEDIRIAFLPKKPITVPDEQHPRGSFCEEGSPVMLPDGRLMMVVRTNRGSIWYTVSEDEGRAWRQPEPLRYFDDGPPVLQPVAPAPLFRLQDGRFLLLYNNNDGYVFGATNRWDPRVLNRRPAFLAVGEYRGDAHQPIWFSAAKKFIDNDAVPINIVGNVPRYDAAAYPSLTELKGERVLWYPDRKHFLLGKIVPDGFLADMACLEPPAPVDTPLAREVRRDHPFAYWCFEEPHTQNMAAAIDQTGNHHGSYHGPVRSVSGISGRAAKFDGQSAHIRTTDLGDFGSRLADGFTLEFWMKTSTKTLMRQPIGVLDSSGMALVVDFHRDGQLEPALGRTNFFLRDAEKRCLSGVTSSGLYDGQWHHVVWVVEDPIVNRAKLYIDGRPDDAYTPARQQVPRAFRKFTQPLVLGAANVRGNTSMHTETLLDEVALYDHPLTSRRVAAHYEAALSASP